MKWKTSLQLFVFLSAHLLLASYNSSGYELIKTQSVIKEQEETLCDVTNSYNITIEELEALRKENKELRAFQEHSVRKRGATKTFGKFSVYYSVNLSASSKLQAALDDYNGPPAMITSLKRPSSFGSKHKSGDAVDISWRVGGKAVIEYLNSTEGQDWLNKHNLSFYIENVPEYKEHPNYLYNKHATGPHIHINIS